MEKKRIQLINEVRETQASVNCIIQYNNKYLFLKRSETKSIDPGLVNVLGGKVEPDENYALAAIREAREEIDDTITRSSPKRILNTLER